MAMLRLTIADGRRLVIPAQSLRTRQGHAPDAIPDLPQARTGIRYVAGGALRTALLKESISELATMVAADTAARHDWVEVELPGGQPFFFLPDQFGGLTEQSAEQPERPGDAECEGANVRIDLEIDSFPLTLYAVADVDALLSSLDPQDEAQTSTPSVRPRNRRAKS